MGNFWMVRRGWKKEMWRSKDLSSGKRRRTEGSRIDKKHLDGKHDEKWIWAHDLNLDLNDFVNFWLYFETWSRIIPIGLQNRKLLRVKVSSGLSLSLVCIHAGSLLSHSTTFQVCNLDIREGRIEEEGRKEEEEGRQEKRKKKVGKRRGGRRYEREEREEEEPSAPAHSAFLYFSLSLFLTYQNPVASFRFRHHHDHRRYTTKITVTVPRRSPSLHHDDHRHYTSNNCCSWPVTRNMGENNTNNDRT